VLLHFPRIYPEVPIASELVLTGLPNSILKIGCLTIAKHLGEPFTDQAESSGLVFVFEFGERQVLQTESGWTLAWPQSVEGEALVLCIPSDRANAVDLGTTLARHRQDLVLRDSRQC
jgi:hypothetical protein